MLIALLDRPQVDDGAAAGSRLFLQRQARGVQDIWGPHRLRNAGESAGAVVNAMVECACDRIVRSSGELMDILSELIAKPF